MVSNLANKQKLATANWPVYGQRNFEIPKRAIKKSNKIYVSPVCIKYINTKCQTMPARAKMVANYTAQKTAYAQKETDPNPEPTPVAVVVPLTVPKTLMSKSTQEGEMKIATGIFPAVCRLLCLLLLLLPLLQTGALWKISLLNYKACHIEVWLTVQQSGIAEWRDGGTAAEEAQKPVAQKNTAADENQQC